MTERLNANAISPEGRKILVSLQTYVERSGLEKRLLEIVKVRASQINGCAFCLVTHTRDAVSAGDTHERTSFPSASERHWPGPKPSPR